MGDKNVGLHVSYGEACFFDCVDEHEDAQRVLSLCGRVDESIVLAGFTDPSSQVFSKREPDGSDAGVETVSKELKTLRVVVEDPSEEPDANREPVCFVGGRRSAGGGERRASYFELAEERCAGVIP